MRCTPLLCAIALSTFSFGCSESTQPRVYEVTKVDTEFVNRPAPQMRPPQSRMMASNIPLAERRIVGAIVPDVQQTYYFKSTDRSARLDLVVDDFRKLLDMFINASGPDSPQLDLPKGWSLRPASDGIAMAEFHVDVPEGKPIIFTVTKLPNPEDPAELEDYLLRNVNRWRSQLELPPIDQAAVQNELVKIPRPGTDVPAYFFDKAGNPTASSASTPAQENTVSSSAPTSPPPQAEPPSVPLQFDRPESWEALDAQPPMRLARFKINDENRSAEVVISRARDVPLANAQMWSEQVLSQSTSDPASIDSLAQKVVEEAVDIEAGPSKGKLYTIRGGDQPEAISLLVAVLPTTQPETAMFVKLKGDLQTTEREKSNFIAFVQSLRWE